MTKSELKALTDKALEAFWEVVVIRFPEAVCGDLSPMTTMQLDTAAENAIGEWIWANVPTSEPVAQPKEA